MGAPVCLPETWLRTSGLMPHIPQLLLLYVIPFRREKETKDIRKNRKAKLRVRKGKRKHTHKKTPRIVKQTRKLTQSEKTEKKRNRDDVSLFLTTDTRTSVESKKCVLHMSVTATQVASPAKLPLHVFIIQNLKYIILFRETTPPLDVRVILQRL